MSDLDLRKAIQDEADALSDDAKENQLQHLNKLIALADAMRILVK